MSSSAAPGGAPWCSGAATLPARPAPPTRPATPGSTASPAISWRPCGWASTRSVLGESEEGARTALPIWIQFMREALRGVPEQHRTMPDGLVTLRISPETGTLVSAENPDGVPEIFMADHLPDSGATAQTPEQASSEPIF